MANNPHMRISDPHAERRERQAELAILRHENMIRKQMDNPVSRSFVWHVLCKLGYMQNILETNASVYGKTAKQSVANDLVKEIKRICPQEFLQMEVEADNG